MTYHHTKPVPWIYLALLTLMCTAVSLWLLKARADSPVLVVVPPASIDPPLAIHHAGGDAQQHRHGHNVHSLPPFSDDVFANKITVYPASDPWYPNETVSSHHPRLRHLLAHWVHLAHTLELRYVAVAGTLLGCLRNCHIIPWDSDLDIAVHGDTAQKLALLAAGSPASGWKHAKVDDVHILWNSVVGYHQPWADGEVRLIVNMHRAQNLPGDGLRYNHKGELVDEQEDSVAFVGPFARLVSLVDGRTAHLDIFCVEEFAGRYGVAATEVGPEKASFPAQVEPCTLEGYDLWCPSKRDYEPMMVHEYGEDYIIPVKG